MTICRGAPDELRQFCKSCGHADRFDFHVTDEVWRAVVPPDLHTRVVCLSCFDAFAARKGIDYSRSFIGPIYFAGDAWSADLSTVVVRGLSQALIAELAARGLRVTDFVRRTTRVLRAVRAEVPRVAVVAPAPRSGRWHSLASFLRRIKRRRTEYRNAA